MISHRHRWLRMMRAGFVFLGVASLGCGHAPAQQSKTAGKKKPANPAALIEAQRALGDGLPQVAAVKAERFLALPGLSAEDRLEAATIAAEGWVRAREGARAMKLLDAHKSHDQLYWRAQAQVLTGDLMSAADTFQRYADNPKARLRDHARLALAYVHMTDGQDTAARREVRELRESSDEEVSRRARLLYNELELLIDRSETVIRRLADETGGKSGDVQFIRAKGWLRLGDAAKAHALLVDLLALPGLGSRLHDAVTVLLAEALMALEKPDEARQTLITFIDKARDSGLWMEAFDLLATVHRAMREIEVYPLTAKTWADDETAPERRGFALFLIGSSLHAAGKDKDALPHLDTLLREHPYHPRESEGMRIAMELHGKARADARVLELARTWRERYGGGGESLVDFITGGIFFSRGDFEQALEAFGRSADLATDLAERRKALYNAALAAVNAGKTVALHSLLGQLQSVGGTAPAAAGAKKTSASAGGAGESAADFQLDQALQAAAQRKTDALTLLQAFLTANPSHPRFVEAKLAAAELSLLDLPARPKQATADLATIETRADLNDSTRQRIDYIRLWTREAEGNLAEVAAMGALFLKKWPQSPLADQVGMKAAEAYFRLGDYANARSQFEQLARDYPKSPFAETALFFAGKSAMELLTPEGLQSAISIWSELAEREGPMALTARVHQVEAKNREGKPGEALELLDELLREKLSDATMRFELECQRVDLLTLLGVTEPKLLVTAIEAASKLAAMPGLPYASRARTGCQLVKALEASGSNAEALEACHDVVDTGINGDPGLENPGDFFWFYWAGFRAVKLLEDSKQYEAAARMAEKLAKTAGDRAADAKALATDIRLKHFLWDETK